MGSAGGGLALVTGAHGFVGSHLAAGLLAAGRAVRVLDRPGPRQTDLGGPRASGIGLLGVRGEVGLGEGDPLEAESVAAAPARARCVPPPPPRARSRPSPAAPRTRLSTSTYAARGTSSRRLATQRSRR